MSVHTFGEYELDRSLYELRRSGAPIDVGPRIFDVLAYLIDHRDRLVSKEELVREVWDATAMSGSSVPTCIAAIRKLLGDDPAKPEFIETLRGRGYRFIAPVTRTTSRYANGIGGADPDALQRSRDVSRPIFVGRESEIASLYAAFEHALAGTPQLVLVAGEAGIGKTRLLEELAPAVRDDGATVLHGRCIEGGGAPAFWPWVQIIRSYTDTPGLPSIPEALGSLAPSLLRMVPEIADRFPNVPAESTEDSDQARFRLYDAVSLLLNRAAVERPLVLLIDDLHRADTASLLLLRFAAREMRDAPILIVGAYREIELQSDNVRSEILSDLTREESTRCIQLHGLTADAVSRLIANSSPSGSPSQSLSIAMHEQTAGNPFFVTQIIHLLAADGRLDDMDEKIEWRFRLPSGIREAVTRQLDGLPEETIRTLSVAAIAGREFSIRVISPALDESVETTLGTLQPVLDSNLITPLPGQVDRYRFAHVLLRDCIYESLPATERIHLHHQIAESLERLHNGNLDPHAAELAYHFSEAIPSTPSNKAIDFSIRAAEWATARLAYEDAPDHYRIAIRNLENEPSTSQRRLGEILLTLGQSEVRAGQRDLAKETLQRVATIARITSDPILLARTALALAPGFLALEVGVFDRTLVSMIEEALDSIPIDSKALRSQLLSRLSFALAWGGNSTLRYDAARSSLEIARELSDPQVTANALIAVHGTMWGPAQVTQRRTLLAEIDQQLNHDTNPDTVLMHKLLLITALLESGEVLEADREIGEFDAFANDYRRTDYSWYSQLFASMRTLMHGNFEQATNLAKQFYKTGLRAQDRNAIHAFAAQFAIVSLEQGQGESIIDLVRDLVAKNPAVTGWRATLAYLYSELGHESDSKTELRRLTSSRFTSLRNNETDQISLNLIASAAASIGDTETAELLYPILLPAAEFHTIIAYAVAYFGPVSDRLGQLAAVNRNWEAVEIHFRRALAECERVNSLPWIAHVKHNFARSLLQSPISGADATALELLRESAVISETLRMPHLESKVATLVATYR